MRLRTFFLMVLVLVIPCLAGSACADSILGSNLFSFAILSVPELTNTRATTIHGNGGGFPIKLIAGESSITLTWVYDPVNTTAALAQSRLTPTLIELGGGGPVMRLASADLTLAGTLLPGLYSVPAGTTDFSEPFTLDGSDKANVGWFFLMPSWAITSSNSSTTINNTGGGAGVYWVIVSTATLNSGTTIAGNILPRDSITIGSGPTFDCGKAKVSTGGMTGIDDTIGTNCTGSEAATEGGNGLRGGPTVTTTANGGAVVGTLPQVSIPEPATLALLLSGLLPIGILWLRKLRSSLLTNYVEVL